MTVPNDPQSTVAALLTRFDRQQDLLQASITQVAVVAEGLRTHQEQCVERERRRDETDDGIRRDLQNHRAFVDETLRRVEHDTRNMRMSVDSLGQNFGSKLPNLEHQVKELETTVTWMVRLLISVLLAIVGYFAVLYFQGGLKIG